MRQRKQHRPPTRAPHGSPEFTEKLATWVTKEQKRAFRRNGGSAWLRTLIDEAVR